MELPVGDLLTPQHKALIAAKMNEHAKNGCPMCHGESWAIAADRVLVLAERPTPGLITSAPVVFIPVVPVVCNTCSFQMHFNAIALGVMDKEGQMTDG